MTEPIRVRNISKTFREDGSTLTAIDKVSFEIQPGEFVCMVGPSGSGKSTLLRIMARLEHPTAGQVDGVPDKIGFVFQNFALFPWLSVADNIGFGLKMAGESKANIAKRVKQELERMGLEGAGSLHPKELSGGMKQRVGIARALAVDPDILFLDEPFSALDEITADELRQDLLNIWQDTGKTIIMVTHLASEAAQLADRIVVFSARPARVVKIITNKLARPRRMRSEGFYRLEDSLVDLLKN